MRTSTAIWMVLCATIVSSATTTMLREPQRVIVPVDRPYIIERQYIKHETFPVPVCAGLETKPSKYKLKQIDVLAAAIPASALRPARTK